MPNWETTSPNGNVNKKFNWSGGILYVIIYAAEFVSSNFLPKLIIRLDPQQNYLSQF